MMDNHAIALKSLTELKDMKDQPSGLPKLTDNTDVLNWFHYTELACKQILGFGNIPIAYIICQDME